MNSKTKVHSQDSVSSIHSQDSVSSTCQNCKKDFTIEPDDFTFYEKIKVPPPTWCPECRLQRRLAFLNIWNLYKRTCAKCKKGFITIYSPEKKLIVYCLPCWWADDWDGTEFAMDYDSSRPFLEQLKELSRKSPWQALESQYLTLTNSDYANAVAHLKNCYLAFWSDYCENVYYSTFLNTLKDSLDCYRMKESELCYEDVGCFKCYQTFFSEECDSCADVWFSRNCVGCTNCFGCVNLRNKSYHIFNEKYSRDEYFEKLKELRLDSRVALKQLRRKVDDFWKRHPRRAYTGSALNINVTGDYIYESKNTRDSYMVTGVEDSRYVQFVSVAPVRTCYDYTGWGNNAELMYESSVCGENVSRVKFSNECFPDIVDVEYSIYAVSCKNVFGCVNLKRRQYCILNKQYSKEEYEELVKKIRDDMTKNPYRDSVGRSWMYGEFLPLDISPFAYNETVAHQFFPKSKEAAIQQGLIWREADPNRHAITINGNDLPDTILDTSETILNEVIKCSECEKAYKIAKGELGLMKKMNLPLPQACPNCRQGARFKRTNPPELYSRKCAKCDKRIATSYALDRPELVYCEQCYQAEVA
jgi:hypothetical protein